MELGFGLNLDRSMCRPSAGSGIFKIDGPGRARKRAKQAGFFQDFSNCCLLERLFRGGHHVVHPTMQRTQATGMTRPLQWAPCDAVKRIDGLDNVEDRQVRRRAGQCEPAMQSSLRTHDAGSTEPLHYLGQVPGRSIDAGGELICGAGSPRLTTQKDHGSQGIFGGL